MRSLRKRKYRNQSSWRLATRAAASVVPGLTVLFVPLADAQTVLPQGGTVASGQATISTPSPGSMVINQSSSRAVVDWNSFSVGAGNSVNFVQPSSSAAILNRVTGATTSTIAGQINANGQVFLVNPNGIAITPTGTVQAGGFVASTLGINNADFNNGAYTFTGNGASAAVSNAGTITANGGYVALLGGTVSNAGTINAYLGRVGLGSGEQIVLNPSGDGFLQVAVPTAATTSDGSALVDVSGRIKARGGQIQINAASAQNAARDVINVSGRLSASSVSGSNGNITLNGGPTGVVTVTGSIAANSRTGKGGAISVTGGAVNLKGAQISASGATGGGTIQIGGGPQGTGTLAHATTVNVDTGTTFRADATVKGDGGNVVIWSDYLTTFGGFISAQGGRLGGNGGLAEVSGKIHLNLNGDYTKLPLANLKAPLGETGTLLFDPGTVSIIDQTTLANNTALNGPDTFTAQFISSQLSSANVTIATANATGANGSAGDINLLSNAQIAWSSNNKLTLNAARDITFATGSSITGSGASSSLVLNAGADGTGVGTVKFAGGTQVNVNGAVDLYYNPASNRTVANGGTNNNAGTVNGTSYSGNPAEETWSSFITAGTTRVWKLVNTVVDLQNIKNALSEMFALGGDVNANATSGWNGGAGFVPLGTDGAGNLSGSGFAGTLDGQGHTISGLTIDRGASDRVGLFGYTSGATIENLLVSGANVTGGSGGGAGSGTGVLVGVADNGTAIQNVSVTGTLTGSASAGAYWNIGGIVGDLNGSSSIASSIANVNITSALRSTGGAVGGVESGSTITNSYATGSVSAAGVRAVGGLVGYNNGSITSSYATGSVDGDTRVGGLVGTNDGTVSQSYATGAVNGTNTVGGLVGLNNGTISSSFFDKDTTGQSSGIGGGGGSATGLTTSQAITQSNYSGWDFTNTWWMQNGNTRPFLRSEYSTTISNAHQLQLINMSSTTLGATYTLRGSIDMSETSSASGMWGSTGFVPLGTDGASTTLNSGNGFRGTFDGANQTISNLFINRPSGDNVGLFGYVDSTGTIANIALTGVNITGRGANGVNDNGVGALVGWNFGTISGSTSSGNVTGSRNVGGLVGENKGTVTQSASTAGVTNTSGPFATGGLVGWNTGSAVISRSFATGSVNASGQYVGGLVGTNNATIVDTYATGSVSGGTVVGGLVGWNTGGSASVTTSYATGAVSGTTVGGFIGNNAATATSSYFDKQTTGTVNEVGAGSATGITGLTTANFQNGSLPSGFSSALWTAANGQYPSLNLSAPQTTPIKITATVSPGTMTYGDASPTVNYQVTDANGVVLCTSDCSAYFSGSAAVDTTAKSTASVGTAQVYATRGTIAAVSGYVMQFVNAAVTIAKKSLTVTASDQTKSYGTNLNLGNSAFTTSGLVNGDTVSSVTLTSSGSGSSAGVAGSPYSIVPSNAIGTGLSNYNVSYANGQLTVTPVSITVSAVGGSSTYGSSPANPGLSATGLVNGETVSVLTGLSNSFGITNTTNAGTYALSVNGSLTNQNYTVTSTSGANWTVNPASVVVTALGGSSTYGSSPSNPGLSATGIKNGETIATLTGLSNSFGITNTTNAGSYATNVAGTLTNGNYTVTGTNAGVWNVNPASVTVTALGGSSTYGSSPSNPGFTATGLQNGQTVSVLTGLSNSFGITSSSDAGNYTMSVAGTLTNGNYTVTTRNTNIWTVNPASITVTALGGNSTYGTSPSNPGLSASGLQNGQTVSVLTGLSNSFGINSATAPGTYAMNVQGTLTNGNYTVTSTVSNPWSVFPVGVPLPPPSSAPPATTGSIGKSSSADIGSLPNVPVYPSGGSPIAGSGAPQSFGGNSSSSGVLAATSRDTVATDPVAVPPIDVAPRPQGLNAMASASKPAEEEAGGGDECGSTGSGGKSGRGAGKGGSGGSGCRLAANGGPLNFALNDQTKNSVVNSIENALTEMISAKSAKYSVARNVTAGTTLLVTAGIIGWLLRGGALLSAMLSSVPLWREFDPLVVVQRPRRRGGAEVAEVEKLFDASAATPAPAQG